MTARSIRCWADTNEAKWTLPHIVRRLIVSTVKNLTVVDFPAYESGQRPGFDGIVTCADQDHPWVPEGHSVWELGTDQDVKRKADRELTKRSDVAKTPREEQARSFFMFVTPRKFTQKREWAQTNTGTGFWRGIRALDADDLEQWGEFAPAGVTAWFGRQIGTRPRGVDDVAQHWSAISKAASSELLPSVFLAGREQSVERVRQWLAGEPDRLSIDCRSPEEVIDFFCAAVAAMDEEDRVAAESRAIVVHEPEAWAVLRDATAPAVLVIDPSLSLPNEEIRRAVANRHHVLVATEPTILAGHRDSELERASEFELKNALEESGYTPVRAEQFARAAGGSLAILKQRLSPPGSRCIPSWASEITSDVITACLLLGGWESNESDQLALGVIASRNYAECESELQRMANSPDPLLLHAAGNWRLISKDHAWSLFEDRVAPPALKKFESLAVEILADDDLRYLLPEDERFCANITGHVPKYSETVKKHVAETLAFLWCIRLKARGSVLNQRRGVCGPNCRDGVVANMHLAPVGFAGIEIASPRGSEPVTVPERRPRRP